MWKKPHPGCGERGACSPAQSAAVTAIPGVVFSGGLDGHLRAYASADGNIIWDIDTAQTYKTVNGVTANGGSLDGPGQVVVEGMVFVIRDTHSSVVCQGTSCWRSRSTAVSPDSDDSSLFCTG